jgi:hypothetical protein
MATMVMSPCGTNLDTKFASSSASHQEINLHAETESLIQQAESVSLIKHRFPVPSSLKLSPYTIRIWYNPEHVLVLLHY